MRRRFIQFGGGARDTQRQKVYNWEEQILRPRDSESLWTLAQCRAMIEWISGDHHVEPPLVTDGRGRRRPCAVGASEIRLPQFARRKSVVIHEVAHTLTFHLLREEERLLQEPPHGARFMRVYVELVVKYAASGWTLRTLMASARASKLDVARDAQLVKLKTLPVVRPTMRLVGEEKKPIEKAASAPGPERLRRLFPMGGSSR